MHGQFGTKYWMIKWWLIKQYQKTLNNRYSMLEIVFINRINSSKMFVFGELSLVRVGDPDSFLMNSCISYQVGHSIYRIYNNEQ